MVNKLNHQEIKDNKNVVIHDNVNNEIKIPKVKVRKKIFFAKYIHRIFSIQGTSSTNTNELKSSTENTSTDEDKQKQQLTTTETEQKPLPPRDYEIKSE